MSSRTHAPRTFKAQSQQSTSSPTPTNTPLKFHIALKDTASSIEAPQSLQFTRRIPKDDAYWQNTRKAAQKSSKSDDTTLDAKQMALWQQKSWALAKSPVSQLFMTGFMLYMSGTSINIFPIIMLIMSLIQPLRAILNVNATFAPFDEKGVDTRMQKALFVLVQCVGMSMVMVKCYYMKLLPSKVDWMHTEVLEEREVSSGFLV